MAGPLGLGKPEVALDRKRVRGGEEGKRKKGGGEECG